MQQAGAASPLTETAKASSPLTEIAQTSSKNKPIKIWYLLDKGDLSGKEHSVEEFGDYDIDMGEL